ncbi:TetR/AcrR family transcriptional regulator [Undibacterium flavidum]|uniref:TetR/AcrR family transcriptional regulator n=1 Tax=Undibacterium flavidum TaxID=2762297 RepID=A0ABR6Y668_9BURK|nr:TetR/AcrR family transcriptional regulator [Undibacterium flavidum]MBC3872106.1 TetR/AcrR family transcriptional regulator [Undibacterium flavidum]
MPRPSQNIDQTLLQSGRILFPQCGCCDLSLRALTEHAQVNMGMFHYHFRSKDNFLSILLQSMYDELFAQLQAQTLHPGTALQRLRQTLMLLAKLLREHGPWLSRVWTDASRGDTVAQQFLQKNGARHIQLILSLILQAIEDKEIEPIAPMQAMSFLMGSIAAPMLIAPRVIQLGFAPAFFQEQVEQAVLSDTGIAQRVDRALFALRISTELIATHSESAGGTIRLDETNLHTNSHTTPHVSTNEEN